MTNLEIKFINYETGVTQGDSLRPLLFNTIMDEIIKKIKTRRKKGYRMGGKELKIIGYADDAIITARITEDCTIQRHFYKTVLQYNYVTVSIDKDKNISKWSMVIPRRC
jgi:hypothetical protein